MKNRLLINEEEKNRILNLHKNAIVKEYSSKFVMEQTSSNIENTSDFCEFNVSNTTGNTLPPVNQSLIDTIKNDVKTQISNSVAAYKSWYNKPDTQAKISNKTLLEELPTFLDTLINKESEIYLTPDSSYSPESVAWVKTVNNKDQANTLGNDWGKIYINAYQLHNGEKYTESLYDVIHHEIGHIIDSFFRVNNQDLYVKTHNEFDQEQYKKNYIINDRDQFSRLNVFRGIIGAEPLDDANTLLTKFMSKVTDGTITSPYYVFSTYSKENYIGKKNDTEESKKIYKLLKDYILVNGVPNFNIAQLFSTYSVLNNGELYVNFNLLSDFNITTAKVDNINQDNTMVAEEKIFEEEEEKNTVYFLKISFNLDLLYGNRAVTVNPT